MKPLLLMNAAAIFKVKPKKKKAKKKVKAVVPTRPAPFEIGDEVWAESPTGKDWGLTTIVKRRRASKISEEWVFSTAKDNEHTESQLLPIKVFRMIANDAVRLKRAPFEDELNKAFGGEAIILGVIRQGQKRPWAYYVIPEPAKIWSIYKTTTEGAWGLKQDHEAKLYICPAKKLQLQLLPISTVAKEILTYLGLHIYTRRWVGEDN